MEIPLMLSNNIYSFVYDGCDVFLLLDLPLQNKTVSTGYNFKYRHLYTCVLQVSA